MITVTRHTSGNRGIRTRLRQIGDSLDDWRGAEAEIHEVLLDQAKRAWSTRGASTRYGRWVGGVDLVKTGVLRASMTNPSHPMHSWKIARRFIQFGTNVRYGSHHQHGTRHLPQRRFIAPTEADKRAVLDVIMAYVLRVG